MKKQYTKFRVIWWLPENQPEPLSYETRKPADIECLGVNHYRVLATNRETGGELEFVLRKSGREWTVRSHEFIEAIDYTVFHTATDAGSTWIDNVESELLVIRAEW